MRDIIHQLFINKFKVMKEIEDLQSQVDFPDGEKRNHELIDALHRDWDKTEHLIDLCFKSLGC